MKIKTNLIVKNDWEKLTYFLGKKQLTEADTCIKIIFPDGLEVIGGLAWRQTSTSYNDMGHTYEATYMGATISLNIHGAKIAWALEDLVHSDLRFEVVSGELGV